MLEGGTVGDGEAVGAGLPVATATVGVGDEDGGAGVGAGLAAHAAVTKTSARTPSRRTALASHVSYGPRHLEPKDCHRDETSRTWYSLCMVTIADVGMSGQPDRDANERKTARRSADVLLRAAVVQTRKGA